MKTLNFLNKTFWLFVALSASTVVFNSCGDDGEPGGGGGGDNPSLTTDPGVVINGVKWATRNVDMPGIFAPTYRDTGKAYQWNRKKAWDVNADLTDWDSTYSTGETWTEANDPSPEGWRVPTLDEISSLLDESKVTYTEEYEPGTPSKPGQCWGVFTDRLTGNKIYFPDGRNHRTGTGMLNYGNCNRYYWSSTRMDRYNVYYLVLVDRGSVDWMTTNWAIPIRPVAK